MKKTLILLVINFYFTDLALGQKDSVFISNVEKKIFTQYLQGTSIELDQLFTVFNELNESNRAERIEQINEHISIIKNSKFEKMSNKKKIKHIYNLTHDRILSEYVKNPSFNETLEFGKYNCVTASALYAIILDELNIEFQVKKTPTHVFINVLELDESTLIESTLPEQGVFEYSSEFKKSYADFLRKNKFLKTDDKSLSNQNIFQKYFHGAETINTYQLASIQYWNYGLEELKLSNFIDAYKNFEKSEYLDSLNNSITYLKYVSLVGVLNDGSLNPFYLARFIQCLPKTNSNLELEMYYFDKASRNIINNSPSLDSYHSFFKRLENNLSDSVKIQDFKTKYYLYCAQFHEVNANIEKAIEFIGKSFNLNQNNLQSKQILVSLITKRLRQMGYRGNGAQEAVEEYFYKYPFLNQYNELCNFRNSVYSCGIMDNLYRRDIDSALQYLDGFDKSVRESNMNQDIIFTVGEVYCDLYRSHLRINKIEKSKTFLKRGYELSPENGVLKNCEKQLIRRGVGD